MTEHVYDFNVSFVNTASVSVEADSLKEAREKLYHCGDDEFEHDNNNHYHIDEAEVVSVDGHDMKEFCDSGPFDSELLADIWDIKPATIPVRSICVLPVSDVFNIIGFDEEENDGWEESFSNVSWGDAVWTMITPKQFYDNMMDVYGVDGLDGFIEVIRLCERLTNEGVLIGLRG